MTTNNYYLILFIALVIISSCSLAPGIHIETKSSCFINNDKDYVYIQSLEKNIEVLNIANNNNPINTKKNEVYKIGVGDQIAVFVWGLPEIFPVTNISPDQNLRRVDSNGNIFFPYVGEVKALNKTQNELRVDMTEQLSKYFNDPQLDLSIARFNSQKVYLLGEVTRPIRVDITDTSLSLADAIGQASGINTSTGSGKEVYVIRQSLSDDQLPEIYRADLSSPSGFLDAGSFYLNNNDVIYVNAKGTTRWNRVVSQFFPFSSFLNSIDNLVSSD